MSTDDCKDESKSTTDDDGSMKWMCSKMRVMRKMVISNSSGTDDNKPSARSAVNKFNDHRSEIKSNTSNNSTEIVRVCSDCNTTKTPLWRGGPQGPKSLCNACGIRRRKARRAMALAAAIENETEDMNSSMSNKMQNKEKKLRTSYVAQHKQHVNLIATSPHTTKKKLGFEDFAMSLISKNSPFRRVLPRDEQEAAILLMALSCGLTHS